MEGTAVNYGRVSDEEQARGKSVENQLSMCRKYAEANGIEVMGEYRDDGKSGRTVEGRPGFNDALNFIGEHKVSFLLVSETDRFARSNIDHHTVQQFLKQNGCRLIAVNQPFTEMETPEGIMMDGIMSTVNEFYSNLYGAKTSRSMQKKIECGEWPGWAPLGYINVNIGTEDSQHNVVRVDPVKGELVKEALKLFSTGNYTVEKLSNIMFERGLRSKHGKKMPKSSFIDMLRNTFYYGMMTYKGILYPNRDSDGNETYEPLISKPTFDQNLEVLASLNKNANRSRKHDSRFFFRRFLQCGVCGGRMTAELHEEKSGAAYYHCSLTKKKHSNKGQNIPAAQLEKMIADQFKKVQLTGPLMEKIIARAKVILEETHRCVDGQRRALLNRKMRLEKRRDNLEEDRADRVIDAEAYKRQHGKVTEDIKQIKKRLSELDDEREENMDVFARLMALTDNLHFTYKEAEPDLKEHLIGLFFEKFVMKDRKITEVKYAKVIKVLLDNRSVIINKNWLPRLDSNQQPIGYTLPFCFQKEWTISSPIIYRVRGASSRKCGTTPLRIVSEPSETP